MLLQAEQMHKITFISLKMVEVVILSENSCHFVSCSAFKNTYFFQLEISHVLTEPAAKNQHRCREPNTITILAFDFVLNLGSNYNRSCDF